MLHRQFIGRIGGLHSFVVALLLPAVITTGCIDGVGDLVDGSGFDFLPGVSDQCVSDAEINTINDFKELPKDLLTRRYRGVVWGENDSEVRPRVYYPATSANSVLRLKLTTGGVLRPKFLIKIDGDDFDWEEFQDFDPFGSGSEEIDPLWVDVSEDGELVYVLTRDFVVGVTDADGILQWRIDVEAGWEFEHFSIFDDYVYVTQYNETTEINRVQRFGLNDGVQDTGFSDVVMPGTNPDTDREISRYRAFVPYDGGYAWVAQLTPLLEGEKVYILEAFSTTGYDGNDDLAWGQILADFGSLRYSTDNLTGQAQLLLQGRERNYRHNVYYIRPQDGWVRSYSNHLGTTDSRQLYGEGIGLACPPNSNGDDVFHIYTVSDGTFGLGPARFSLGLTSTEAYILENY